MRRIILFLALAFVFLTSCNGGYTPIDIDYYVGTKGVVMEIITNEKPTRILENSELYSTLQIRNEGAYSIDDYFEDRYGYLTINFDNYYISVQQPEVGPPDPDAMFIGPPSPIAGVDYDEVLRRFSDSLIETPDKAIVYPFPVLLEGKSMYNPPGGQDLYELRLWINTLQGQRESPETQIIYTLCYPYKTIFSNDVCIDADPYDMDERRKVCTSRTETYSQGQGAPISVVKIEPTMSKSGTTVQPSFRIYLRNTGKGSVLSYDPSDGMTHSQRCNSENIERLDWNKVRIKASLSGKELDCSPDKVLIKLNQEAYGFCRLKEEDMYAAEFVQASNYYADLNIELDYIYVSTAIHQIEIMQEGS